jgi:nitrogen fixation protein NifU and related proteins
MIPTQEETAAGQDALSSERLGPRFHEHSHFPKHMGPIAGAQGRAVGVGSCGDSIEIALRLEGETIVEIGHIPRGCAYTVACASAVSSLASGRSLDAALLVQPEDVERELGGLPEDHRHCARLAVNTLGEAIADAYQLIAASMHRKD